ncbi:putative FBD-associated F-box protein At1g55030 [Ziziphus jujuba]|uniref:FBD-associated F-box protein At1g55030 n=1 Tax=Ziziphus jujuba TaxID=326968 RepID=A0A6P4AMD0_ZIZJJ|nr:putative FBD-associated F-box protein At1g55030 [Ziziphus jujuba]
MDVFSSLPEPIIHHIMSLVPAKDATHMSILSNTFHSSWRSFPIMDFDFQLFIRSCSLDDEIYGESFLDFVVNSLQYHELTTSLEKLRFCGSPGGYKFDSMFKRMINFALDNNVRELELHFHIAWRLCTYCLPPAIFSAKSIKTLTLIAIALSQDLILSCPCIKSFNLISCHGFKTVFLASNAKLKALRIEEFSDIKDFHFESPALCLESFSFHSFVNSVPVKFNISGYTTPNLKYLRLKGHGIPDRLFESINAEFPYLEALMIQDCNVSKKKVKIHLEYLKTLELNMINFSKLEIEAPRMVSFTYKHGLVRTTENDISIRCTNLKYLRYRATVPYRWIRNSFSEFLFLETLKLHIWSENEKIKFHFECLKTFKLHLGDPSSKYGFLHLHMLFICKTS